MKYISYLYIINKKKNMKIEISKLAKIQEIAQNDLRWTSCSDQDGNHWKEPYIKCDNERHANSIVRLLFAEGINANVDLYEDEDGDGDYGRPIIRKIWSVKIKM